MVEQKIRVSSGVGQLDVQLGGLFIGDNVVWYDDAGSLAAAFSLHFIKDSLSRNRQLIYITFDRSPKTLLENLGALAESQQLTILDCFTHGKGDGSDVFKKFYEKDGAQWPFQIVRIKEPGNPDVVSDAIYSLHGTMKDDVRLVFESLTGMQDLWGGEEAVIRFYARACPRLYELETIAYWIMEKGAHTERLRANINQIAQVVIELSINRGKSALTIRKADRRKPDALNAPLVYWDDGLEIAFAMETGKGGSIDIGGRLKQIRSHQAMSQKELAAAVGVTPSTISQIETGTIYPSIPALIKIAQVLNVSAASFFRDRPGSGDRVVFAEGATVGSSDFSRQTVAGRRFFPPDLEAHVAPYIVEIPAGKKIASHFLVHKGEELGYLLSGTLELTINNRQHRATAGDVIYLKFDLPSQWTNPGAETAKLLWINIKK